MTIGELEALLDMPRASIRFYEQEGFIHPKREANNYRDYSEEDADTLRKVKLLRQLGLSLEDIRQAQRGERPLAALLAEQEAALARQRADLDWAGQMCRAMREDGVDFATLDAPRYLNRLNRPADQPGFFDLRSDAAPTVSHPWRRYFARSLDLGLCSLLWMAVCLFLFRWHPDNTWPIRLLNSYAAYGILLVLEPVLLCTWGYTPGKWIFGLAVRSPLGQKLTWGKAVDRTWGVFARGEGYGIPFYRLWRKYKCYCQCKDGEPEAWEEDTSYTIRDTRVWRCWGFVAARAALIGLSVFLALQSMLPIHRGPLTPEQYAANVNDMMRILGDDSPVYLDDTGHWVQDTTWGDGFLMDLDGPPPDHQLTVDEDTGLVTAVKLEVARTGAKATAAPIFQQQVAALCFAAAQGRYNGFTWWSSGILDAIANQPFESYTLQAGDVTITQTVETRGYESSSSGMLFSLEGGTDTYYHLVFTLELEQAI